MSIYEKLSNIDVSHMVEKKGPHELSYIPWADAWDAVKQVYPGMEKTIRTWDGSPVLMVANGGMVHVSVSIPEGDVFKTESTWLSIMDNRNNSVPTEKITTRDVNDTIQRALVKALALHGFGINVYKGEDFQVKSDDIGLSCSECNKQMDIQTGKDGKDYWRCRCGYYELVK